MKFRRSSTVVIIVLSALAGLLAAVDQYRPLGDSDFFWHLKTGEWIWQHKELPSTDPFAYTTPLGLSAAQRFTLTSYWLSQTAFYLLYLAGGFPAIVFLKCVLVGVLVLTLMPRRQGDSIVFTAVLALGLVVLGMFTLERPQTFSFILFGVLLNLLASFRDPSPDARRLLAALLGMPALMLVWANVHGGHLLGQATILLVVGLEGVKFLRRELEPMPAARYRWLVAAGLLGLVFSLANPNSYHAIDYLRTPVPLSQITNLEYQSTIYVFTRINNYRIAVFWLLLALALAGLAARGRRADITTVALLVGLGAVSFFRSRYVPFFVVAAVPAVAWWLSAEKIVRWSRPAVAGLALLSLLYYIRNDWSLMMTPGSRTWVDLDFPAREADFILREGLQGNMYNNPNWGGYLIWRLAPERKVFSDGRNLDPLSYWSTGIIDSARPPSGPGVPAWRRLLDGNGVQYVVIPLFSRGQMYPLVSALLEDREWDLVFTGYNSLIFVRKSPLNERVISARGLPKERFLDDTIAWYTRQSAREPGNVYLHLTRGELLLARKKYAEARAAYARALELAPFLLVARERLQSIPYVPDAR